MSFFRQWRAVGAVAEFAAADRKTFYTPDGLEIGVYRVADAYYAVSNTCPHAEASMVAGLVEDHEIECPLHGARFDLRTGAVIRPPATRGLKTYEVKVEGDRVWVKC